MDKREQTQRLSEIVNEKIKDFTNQDANLITTEYDFTITNLFTLTNFDIFHKIFALNAPIQKCANHSFFHYKNFDRACEFLKNDYIKMSALSNFDDEKYDDIKEYEYFMETTNLLPDKTQIDSMKNGLYIFCLTEDNDTNDFWERYADNEKGLCIEMEIIDNKNKNGYMYNLNKICYDTGAKFKFFADMQSEISNKLKGFLMISGLVKFAALFKRNEYNKERETRLLINWNQYAQDLGNIFSLSNEVDKYDKAKKFLTIPFDNDIFTIKIKSVALGKNITDLQKQQIEELLKQKNIKQINR